MKNYYQKNINRYLHLFLFALIFVLSASGIARAATTYSFNLDGQQAGTNSGASGFGAIFVNESENNARILVKFQDLSSVPDFNYGVRMIDENGSFLRHIGLHAQTISQTLSYAVTAQELAKMKEGKISVVIITENFPNGEIGGKVRPYSGFVGRLLPSNINPPGDANGNGFVAVVLNRQETDGILYYQYAGLNAPPDLIALGATVVASVGMQTSGTNLSVLSHLLTVNAEFVKRLKRGRHSLSIHRNLQNVLQGFPKTINKDIDFGGDARADKAVYRPGNATFYWLNSFNQQVNSFQFGSSASIPVPSDYDGDGMTDYAVWLPSNGYFYVWNAYNNSFKGAQWGKNGDIPVPADYDGDGKTDFAVYRSGANNTQSVFWVLKSTGGHLAVPFGLGDDKPLIADFDGDRASDITVWRPSDGTFYSILSGDGTFKYQRFGISTDIPKAADFDGDGKSDYVAYRTTGAEAGVWYVLASSDGFSAFKYGLAGDKIQPADYDGDGKADYAVFRIGSWYVAESSGGYKLSYFGTIGDKPVTGR